MKSSKQAQLSTAQNFSKLAARFPPHPRQRLPTFVTFPPLNFSLLFCNPSTKANRGPTEKGKAGTPPGRRQRYLFRGAEGPVPGGRCPAEQWKDAVGWSTLRITRPRLCDQTCQQLGPTVLAKHLAIICWRRRPALCSCDWLSGPGQDCIGFSRPHSVLWLLLLSKPSKEIIPCFIDNL